MSDKRARFGRLAEKRVNRAIRELRLIGNLSNRSAYSFTDEEVRKIFRALQRELNQARSRFGEGESGETPEFRL